MSPCPCVGPFGWLLKVSPLTPKQAEIVGALFYVTAVAR